MPGEEGGGVAGGLDHVRRELHHPTRRVPEPARVVGLAGRDQEQIARGDFPLLGSNPLPPAALLEVDEREELMAVRTRVRHRVVPGEPLDADPGCAGSRRLECEHRMFAPRTSAHRDRPSASETKRGVLPGPTQIGAAVRPEMPDARSITPRLRGRQHAALSRFGHGSPRKRETKIVLHPTKIDPKRGAGLPLPWITSRVGAGGERKRREMADVMIGNTAERRSARWVA